MNITCKQDHLYKAIHAVGRVTGKQTTLPILENILIETQKGQIQVTATNLEIGIVTSIGGKISEPGRVVVPTKIFSEFIGNLPSESVIAMQVENDDITLSSGSHKAHIKGFSVEDYPIIPQAKKPALIAEFNAQKFKESLVRSMVCVAVNNIRVEFTGVNMVLGKESSYFAATDSFRLIECAVEQLSVSMEAGQETESIIIPHKTVSEMVKLIDPKSKKVTFTLEDGQLFIDLDGGIYMVSRLINGKFPDYKQIIPTTFSTQVLLQKEECLRAVRLAGLFSDIKSAEVVFSIDPQEESIEFSTHSSQVGENTSTLTADIIGSEQEILFNPRFIMDALNIIEGDKVSIQLNDASSPAVFCGVSKEGQRELRKEFQYILMPIRK